MATPLKTLIASGEGLFRNPQKTSVPTTPVTPKRAPSAPKRSRKRPSVFRLAHTPPMFGD